MESIIKINDITIDEWQNGIIEFEVTDEDNNPVSGKTVVKLDQKTFISSRVENGKFSQEINGYDLHNDSYDVDVIYGGNDNVDPCATRVTLYINKSEPITFKINELQNASYRLTKWIDVNKRLPGKIAINEQQVTIGNLVGLLANTIYNIDNDNQEDVELSWVATPQVSSENITNNIELSKDEYMAIVEETINYINEKRESPSTIDIAEGKIGFMNILYTFAKIISNSSEYGLISKVHIKPWKTIIAK